MQYPDLNGHLHRARNPPKFMARHLNFHERLSQRDAPPGSSDRAFGFVFVVVFSIVGLWPLTAGEPPRVWALAMAGALLAVALIRPRLLRRPNRLWTQFGLLLHKLVNPIVLGVLFYGVITPFGLARRLVLRDPLGLAFDRQAESYWIRRDPGPAPETMTQQF